MISRILALLCSFLLLATYAYAANAIVEVYNDVHDTAHPVRPPHHHHDDDDAPASPSGGIKHTPPNDPIKQNSKINVNVEFGPLTSPSGGKRKFASVLGPHAFAPPNAIVHGVKPVKSAHAVDTPKPKPSCNVVVTPTTTPVTPLKSVSARKENDDDNLRHDDTPVNVNVEFDDRPASNTKRSDGRKIDTVLGADAYAPPESEKPGGDDDNVGNGGGDRKMDTAMGDQAYTPPKWEWHNGGGGQKMDSGGAAKVMASSKTERQDEDMMENEVKVDVEAEVEDEERRPVSALDLPNGEGEASRVGVPDRHGIAKNKEMMVIVIDYP